MSSEYFISADLGQMNDYTAISILERRPSSKDEKPLHLRHIERPPLGTSYVDIVARLKALTRDKALSNARKTVILDKTGVGQGVFDMARRAGFDGKLRGITITGGTAVTRESDTYHVPKRDLVMSLVIALQNGQLRIARDLPLADVLLKEMLNFKVKISDSGHDSYAAARESAHDDLVLSAAMGVWLASQRQGTFIKSQLTF